jgi:hypothetical protein
VSKTEIRGKHFEEKDELERTHLEELNNFNAEWDSIQRQFETDIDNVEAEML